MIRFEIHKLFVYRKIITFTLFLVILFVKTKFAKIRGFYIKCTYYAVIKDIISFVNKSISVDIMLFDCLKEKFINVYYLLTVIN